jgi:alkylation response protein AidB-like acyl-CoA dehydrogenase
VTWSATQTMRLSEGADLVGTYPAAAGVDVLSQASPVLAELAADAERIDREGVRPEQVSALRRAGVLTALAPVEHGGAAPAVGRELVERLAGCSGSMWFVATQHGSPMRAAIGTSNAALRERWAVPLASGEALGAVAFAHVRRSGPPSVRAERVTGGWRIDGRLDWLTSWGLADVVLLFAQTDDDRIVQSLLPAAARPGWEVTGPLELAAMAGTSTVGVRLDSLHVDDAEVADVVPRQDWLAGDHLRTVNTNPAVIGLLRAVVDDLHRLGTQRAQPLAVDVALQLADEVGRLRAQAYRLLDDVAEDRCVDERLALRAQILALAQRAAVARITVEGGAAMSLRSPAQRWAREAMFHLVQAQTQPLREALLATFGGVSPANDTAVVLQ